VGLGFKGGGGDSRWYMFPVRKDLNNANHCHPKQNQIRTNQSFF